MHEVEELERSGWAALSGPNGAAFYEELMADDGLMIFPGLILDKQGAVRAITGERPWSRHALDDVRVVGDQHTAAIAYHAVAQRTGGAEYRARMTSVYVRRGDRWRLLLHQQSPDPHTDS
jgi:uncharacterized protein (TIGR02246 family)